jgi:hypothetical protein
VWVRLEPDEQAAADDGTIPVARAESCPESANDPRTVIVVEDE